MNSPENLAALIAAKTDEQLLEMLREPQNWQPAALDLAGSELLRRGVPSLEPEPTYQIEAPTGVRPRAISVVCIWAVLGLLTHLPMIFSDATRKFGAWYPPYLGFSTLLGIACFVGFWTMRKWALFLYTSLWIFNQIVMLSTGHWSPFSLLIPGIMIAIGFKYLDRMR